MVAIAAGTIQGDLGLMLKWRDEAGKQYIDVGICGRTCYCDEFWYCENGGKLQCLMYIVRSYNVPMTNWYKTFVNNNSAVIINHMASVYG